RWIDTGIAFHSAEARPVSITHPSTRRAALMILPAGCSQCWSLSSSAPNAPLTNTISLAGSSTVRYGTSAGKPAGMCFVEGMLSSPEQYVHLSLSQWRFGTVFDRGVESSGPASREAGSTVKAGDPFRAWGERIHILDTYVY